MQDEKDQTGMGVAQAQPVALRKRMLEWAQRAWRPAGTLVAVSLALLFGWSVVNGKHTQDQQLRQEIEELQQENAHLRDHIERLKSDPDAIEHEAREKLHYARPGEVIYTLPEPPPQAAQPANGGK
jgi:cell division protein FtsB